MMKHLYLILLLMMLSIPLSSAQQSLQQPATGNIVMILKQLDQALAKGQTDTIAAAWTETENEWQTLFADSPTLSLNKTYNQWQVSYLGFQQHQDLEVFRQELATVLEALVNKR